jgi:GTPase
MAPDKSAHDDERLARVEVKVDQVAESVERVEDKMDMRDAEIEALVHQNREQLQPIHTGVQILKYGLPLLIALLGVAATLAGAVPYVG